MRKELHFLGLVLVLFCFLTTSKAVYAQQDTVAYTVPESKNAALSLLIPPPCFEPSKDFNGYLCLANGSAIMMQLIENVSYLQATQGMTDEFFRTNGFTYISVIDLKSTHNLKGKVYKLTYVHKELEYVRYMVFAGDLTRTLWLNITYPKVVEELMELEVLKSLQTLTLNPADNEK
jgi:hypothetical protein